MTKITIRKHPDIDFFSGFVSNTVIPTKQDKYKPFKDVELFQKNGNDYIVFDTSDLYIKKEPEETHKEFENSVKNEFQKMVQDDPEYPIKKPQKVEVILDVMMKNERLKQVDIDNLSKSLLDCLSGIIIEDDSQINNILATKSLGRGKEYKDGFMLGVRKIQEDASDSWFSNVKIAYYEEENNKNSQCL